jgi:uncharacterized membrane protein
MATHRIRTQDRDGLARFLGWFSIGLGTAQVVAPRALCRVIGAKDDGTPPLVMRVMGVRELAQGSGILVRPRPTMWVWSRVVGDLLDLGALVLTARRGNKRTFAAIANVLPITVADIHEARFLMQKDGAPQSGKLIRKAVTINKPRQDVESAWDLDGYTPTFTDAPGGRGTEVAVEFTYDPPAGDFGVLAGKLTGSDPATKLSDELRRFKARVETGEVVRSDSTPDGHLLANHLRQRAAQPLEREEVEA